MNDTERLQIMVTPEVSEAIRNIAEQEDVSVSEIGRRLLRQAVGPESSSNKRQLNMNVSKELYDCLYKIAQREETTVTDIARQCLPLAAFVEAFLAEVDSYPLLTWTVLCQAMYMRAYDNWADILKAHT